MSSMATPKDPPNASSEATATAEPPERDLFRALEPEPEPEPEPLEPVGEPKILVGTASWTDPSLINCGRFYPKGCNSAEDRLRHYASRFRLVEVNSSYYGLPSRSNSELWVERTQRDFIVSVKAFRLLTGHQTPLDVLPMQVCALPLLHTRNRTSSTKTCRASRSMRCGACSSTRSSPCGMRASTGATSRIRSVYLRDPDQNRIEISELYP